MEPWRYKYLYLHAWNVPDADDLGFFSGDFHVGLFQQTADVRDGLYGGGDEPGQTEQRTDEDQDSQNEQVQVIAVWLLYSVHLNHIPRDQPPGCA